MRKRIAPIILTLGMLLGLSVGVIFIQQNEELDVHKASEPAKSHFLLKRHHTNKICFKSMYGHLRGDPPRAIEVVVRLSINIRMLSINGWEGFGVIGDKNLQHMRVSQDTHT